MTIRSVRRELEARLTGLGGGLFSRPSGKVERTSYGDGGERLKISLRNIKVPDGAEAVATVDGQELARVALTSGRGRLDTETQDASAYPELEIGQKIVVSVSADQVLSGRLYRD